MAGTSPRLPEQYYHQETVNMDFHVNELAADQAGGLSPFGPDVEFPLPLSKIHYTHPGPEDRPNLADGR
jgi:succinate dehydrogenase / fumarate reductase, iron-sulfur subunit